MATTSITYGFNDPLYLHPSDSPGAPIVCDPLTGAENYGVWSRAMLLALTAKNKVGFIDGSCVRPSDRSPSLHQWERCNAIVLSWIMSSVSKEIFAGIVYCTDASKVWADLKERFNKVSESRIYSIQREIVCLKQGSSPISIYFSKLKQLWDEYASLVTLPSCACATTRAYVEHEQTQCLIQFLMSLNDSYSSIRSQILMMSQLPSVSQAFAIVSQEEAHRTTLTNQSMMEVPTAMFYSSSDKKSDLPRCENCNIVGHTKEVCYKLVGYPSGHKLHRKFPQEKFSKNHMKNHQQLSTHNTSQEHTQAPASVPSFTPTQYEQIIKLLELAPGPTEPAANFAGAA
ncbi:hypothetical protein F511_32753 [Dorcoceras hygrometricum]|uniref:Retrotransposon Copia-like N-terminal domain-containing protein n=1 Tax=Dorcoceras hygrometricum TaxID=472368 RepID=A0A2Z7BTI4_9LAMI|nr:hypothetical protein F511_32753 [Dorcoceras hygrometricum]